MANCADDLTQIDYDASAAANAHLASTTSSSSSNSLFPLIEFTHSHALNIDSNDPDNALKRVLRPLDSRDAVLDNQEIVGTAHEGAGGVWTAGSIETQEGDDELIIHVRMRSIVLGALKRSSPTSPPRIRSDSPSWSESSTRAHPFPPAARQLPVAAHVKLITDLLPPPPTQDDLDRNRWRPARNFPSPLPRLGQPRTRRDHL
jgi:hypothetical protein